MISAHARSRPASGRVGLRIDSRGALALIIPRGGAPQLPTLLLTRKHLESRLRSSSTLGSHGSEGWAAELSNVRSQERRLPKHRIQVITTFCQSKSQNTRRQWVEASPRARRILRPSPPHPSPAARAPACAATAREASRAAGRPGSDDRPHPLVILAETHAHQR